MKRNRIVLVVALAMFVASFFCASAMGSSKFITTSEFSGWFCAYVTLLMPWGHDPSLNHSLLGNMALLFSGLINPIFLVTVVLMIRERAPRLVNALRIVLLLMLPSCWVVFLDQHIWPRYGYFLWVAAILLVLFSGSFSNQAVAFQTRK